MRGQPGWAGGRPCPRAGAMLSHSLWCRVPGKLDPTGPFPASVPQNKALQAERGR